MLRMEAKKGNVVKVHYTGKLTDETIFDSSREREPLEFTVGAGQMIKGFDAAVEGMKVGESKQVQIPCTEAYGPVNEEAFVPVSRNQLPDDVTPQIGMQLELHSPQGNRQVVAIKEIEEDKIILDANHPLAGKDLIFDIELMAVN